MKEIKIEQKFDDLIAVNNKQIRRQMDGSWKAPDYVEVSPEESRMFIHFLETREAIPGIKAITYIMR